MSVFDTLLKYGKYFEVYVAARYCYRVGLPTIPDDVYDQIEERLRNEEYERCKEYLNRSYDDDPVPSKLLEILGIEEVATGIAPEMYGYLEEEKSNSIKPVRSFEEAYEFAKRYAGKELMVSLKMDGVNAKILYLDNQFKLSLSRGRASNSLDYTAGAKRIVPRRIEIPGVVKITGESFVSKAALAGLREKYNSKKYKTSKSSAISMLLVEHNLEDYKHLNFLAFSLEGGSVSSVAEMYAELENKGFQTPPHFLVMPPVENLDIFSTWLKENVFNVMAGYKEEYPSDGIVLEVNDLMGVYAEQNQYSERQIALKFEQWGFECLQGVIDDIVIEQQRVYKSVRIKIKPIYSSDGCKAEYINSFNPSILIENELYVGKTVWFERNAGAVNILIHGKRLKEVLDEDGENGT